MRLKPRMPLVLLAAVLAGLVVLGGAAPAGAQDSTESGRILHIEAANNQIEIVFQAILPEGTDIDRESVRVRLGIRSWTYAPVRSNRPAGRSTVRRSSSSTPAKA